MADPIVPLISSDATGPLGIKHLPRLWTKLTLGAAGRLFPGYDLCGDGFDEQAVLQAAQGKLNSRAPVRLVRLAEIPRNAMGKPLRQQLSQDALAATPLA